MANETTLEKPILPLLGPGKDAIDALADVQPHQFLRRRDQTLLLLKEAP